MESLIADISSSSSQSKGRKYDNHKHFYDIHIHIISTSVYILEELDALGL